MMGESGSLLEIALMIPVTLAVFVTAALYPFFQLAALVMWNGWWRLAAVPPLVVMLPVGVQMIEYFRQGASLAPIPFLLTAPFAAGWLGLFAVARRLRAS